MSEINNKLFNLIKKHEWNEFLEIYNNKQIDLNIQDEYNNYLVYYIILYNRLDILKQLERNYKLDFLDNEGRSILYIPIKYGYNDILDFILDLDKHTIGLKIVDIIDKFKTSTLNYALKYKNTYAFMNIIKLSTDINIRDGINNNILQNSVLTNNIEYITEILKYNININNINKDGLAALHIACINRNIDIIKLLIKYKYIDLNIQENKYKLTPIMYLTDNKYIDIIKELINLGTNIELQDVNGNTILHHTIIEGYPQTTFFLLDYYKNLNIVNTNGKLPLHLCLENNNNTSYPIKELINKTNLNIQDMNGNTCAYLLVKNDMWKNFINILETRPINIFIKNMNGECIYDIQKSDEFLNIVIKSYYNRLLTNKKDWILDWEIKCGVKIVDKDKCYELIKKEILINKKSLPYNKKYYNINIDTIFDTNYNTFIGIPLDILFGCIYLMKNKNVFTPLNLGVYFRSQTKIENMEILWRYLNLEINNLERVIYEFNQTECNFLVIPLGIELEQGAHANILIYDKKNNIIERFEPYGNSHPMYFYYNPKQLDKLLQDNFKILLPNVQYLSPNQYLPNIGFQYFESYQQTGYKLGDPNGFCAAWCIWYVMQKIKYDNLDSEILVKKLLIAIKNKNVKMREIIRSFSKEITDMRDNVLKYCNIDINKYFYDDVDEIIIKKMESKINDIITNL